MNKNKIKDKIKASWGDGSSDKSTQFKHVRS